MRAGALLLAAALALAGPLCAEPPPERVVYHLDSPDPARQRTALRMIQTLLDLKGAHRLDVVVVAGRGAVTMFEDIDGNRVLKQRVRHLKSQGVRFELDATSLARRDLALSDLYETEPDDIVPNALQRLVRLQEQGYAYVKP